MPVPDQLMIARLKREAAGTIDELIRHAVSKLSHTHFVANEDARRRLMQMGEHPSSIFAVGSALFLLTQLTG